MSKEQPQPPPEPKKIHKTHFPVVKTPLKEGNFNSGYEWVDKGNGHWIRILKKTESENDKDEEVNPSG